MTRVKLCDKYHNKREEICKKLIEIVGTEFFLCDLDEDAEKQTTILAMKDDIQKVFAVSSISTFKPNLKDIVKRDYLNLVRGILKQHGYTFEGKNSFKKINDEGFLKRTIKYKIKKITIPEHKIEKMVFVKKKSKSKICIHPDCKKQPTFNKEGQSKALYCSAHKLENMVNVISKICIHPDCKIIPSFNKEGQSKALYCSAHKLENMVNVISKTCKSDWCKTHVNEKYEGYCLFCYMNLFPDKPVSRNYKTKEYAVVEHVKNKFPNYKWIADKIVNGGCSKRRPDLLLDLLYQIVIIEVDENQHTDYDCSCQNKRIMELSQDLGHRPIVFIRFNPDNYKQNGTNITSCWGQTKNGICVVKPSKKSEWEQRLNTLEEHISYWITPTNITNKTIETIQLFYDM